MSNEQQIEFCLWFGHASVYDLGICWTWGPLIDAEQYTLPASSTKEQIVKHIIDNCKHTWDKLTVKQFLEEHKEGAQVILEMDTQYCKFEMRDSVRKFFGTPAVTLVQARDLHVKERIAGKENRPFLLSFAIWDKVKLEQVAVANKKSRAENICRWKREKKEFFELLTRTHEEISDEVLIRIIALPLESDNPYNYVDMHDNSEIEKNRPLWEHDMNKAIDKLLCTWAQCNPKRVAQINSLFCGHVFPSKLAKLNSHAGNALFTFLCSPIAGDTGGWYHSTCPWTELLAKIVTPLSLLSLVTTVRLDPEIFYSLSHARIAMLPRHWVKPALQQDSEIFTKAPFNALPKEFTDVVKLTELTYLPNVLPEEAEIVKLSDSEIEARVCEYCGLTSEQLHKTLYPEGSSVSGFLKNGDKLGSVIKRDAETLIALKVSRETLARKLCDVIQAEPQHFGNYNYRDEFSVTAQHTMGFQEDPFHPSFLNPCATHTDATYVIKKNIGDDHLVVAGLVPLLIERLCFFETSSYRVDPAFAIKFFGL